MSGDALMGPKGQKQERTDSLLSFSPDGNKEILTVRSVAQRIDKFSKTYVGAFGVNG